MSDSTRVLVVTEDPQFVEVARATLVADGLETIACMGPVQTECLLECEGSCSLAEHARVVIVDPPPGGMFRRHEKSVPANRYAEKLAHMYPDLFVLLADDGRDVSNEVAQAKDAPGAIAIVHDMLRPRSIDRELSISLDPKTKGDPQ